MSEDPISWTLEEKLYKFLDIVFRGKHHVRKFERCSSWAVVVPHGSMATVDNNELTKTVLAAHELGLRVEITNNGNHGIKLFLHSRNRRDGSICEKHPTIIDTLRNFGIEVVAKADHDAEVSRLNKAIEELQTLVNSEG